MTKSAEVIVIGAGTSGLTARREVAKKTQNYLVVDNGELGTTCARVGCMPSKVLIQVANDHHQMKKLKGRQLIGGDRDKANIEKVMQHVRSLRDRFVRGVLSGMEEWQDHFIKGRAEFIDPHTVKINDELYEAEKIVVATGSRPILPAAWLPYKNFFLDTDSFFEQEALPSKVLIVGLGVIGLEIGQALGRLDIEVVAAVRGHAMGGLTDPELQEYTFKKINEEFKVFDSGVEFIGDPSETQISAKLGGDIQKFDKVILAVGRRPNIDQIGLENIGVKLNSQGLPKVDLNTMALVEKPHIFLPGDVNATNPILHEAADEGKIAGFNAVNEEVCFKRRTPLGITFCEPNIATIGEKFVELQQRSADFVTGKVSFEGQGRSIVKLKEQGLLHVYVDRRSAKILGAELQAPGGEHLAHLLAWAISLEVTVFEALKLPFYHPVIEEGLRTALRSAAGKIDNGYDELFRREDPPIR